MKRLIVTSPLPPSVNHYCARRYVTKNGRPMAINYKTKEAVHYQNEFKKTIRNAVIAQNWNTDLTNPRHFYVDANFYFDRGRKDPNNYWKCLLDAITETELIWADDDIVCERVNRIAYDAKKPRIELCIYYVDYIGIFDNEKQKDIFIETNCKTCKRFARNCTVLSGALEGKVQEGVTNTLCGKFSHSNKKE